MLIRVKDKKLFIKKNGFILYDEVPDFYEVLAIIAKKKEIKYLVQENGIPTMYTAKYFEILDDVIPNYWIFQYFKYNNIIKNKKYMFDIGIDMYIGPKDYINDPDFLFNVFEDPKVAGVTLYEVQKKYGNIFHTRQQT